MRPPEHKPQRPFFGSGPTAKRPGWDVSVLNNALLGRSHRHGDSIACLRQLLGKTRALLGIPADYKIAIMAGGATGAMEAAFWSLLGPRPVDVFAWDVFGRHWANAIRNHLHCPGQDFTAPQDLPHAHPEHDHVLVWNGSTSGVCLPVDSPLPRGEDTLVICDATSAAFAVPLPWDALDAVGFSWQKGLGGEGAHGMLVLSPRAIARLEKSTPPWPIPRLYQLTQDGALLKGIFDGLTLNTPSMMCVADFLDALTWADTLGGAPALYARTRANADLVSVWVSQSPWAHFLVADPTYRSPVTLCLDSQEPWYQVLGTSEKRSVVADICALLDQEKAAFDIRGHIHDTPCLRLWCGPTVESDDLKALFPWLDWAYDQVKTARLPTP